MYWGNGAHFNSLGQNAASNLRVNKYVNCVHRYGSLISPKSSRSRRRENLPSFWEELNYFYDCWSGTKTLKYSRTRFPITPPFYNLNQWVNVSLILDYWIPENFLFCRLWVIKAVRICINLHKKISNEHHPIKTFVFNNWTKK